MEWISHSWSLLCYWLLIFYNQFCDRFFQYGDLNVLISCRLCGPRTFASLKWMIEQRCIYADLFLINYLLEVILDWFWWLQIHHAFTALLLTQKLFERRCFHCVTCGLKPFLNFLRPLLTICIMEILYLRGYHHFWISIFEKPMLNLQSASLQLIDTAFVLAEFFTHQK
jgi:hypothetical protein